MHRIFTLFSACLLLPLALQAQTTAPVAAPAPGADLKQVAAAKFATLSPQERQRLRPMRKPTMDAGKQQAAQQFAAQNPAVSMAPRVVAPASPLPANMIVPGEHEEMQAIMLAWPSYAYDAGGDFLDPDSPGYGYKQVGSSWVRVPIAGFMADTFTQYSYMPHIWGELANKIQGEMPVWIISSDADDTTDIKDFMAATGRPLTNYKFMVSPIGSNAFWIRDWGPLFVYQGANDDLGMIDLHYYPGRTIDDMLNAEIATAMNVPYYKTKLELEGGNFFSDGYGRIMVGDVLYENNADNYGFDMQPKPAYSAAAVRDSLKRIFRADTVKMLRSAVCDGGTGHIDIYMRQLDEERIAVTEFESRYNRTAFPDYGYYVTNNALLRATGGPYGRRYQLSTVEFPRKNNGGYIPAICDSVNEDARNYINGLSINNLILIPTYSHNGAGLVAQDKANLDKYRKMMPGYRVEGIDSRELTVMGGALHCVTMQVPAENPLRIWHPFMSGSYAPAASFPLRAKITNRSGIASAKTFWRKRGAATWDSLPMNMTAGEYAAALPGAGFAAGDTIEYFIKATSNNGKTLRKPLAAPAGYYQFTVASPVGTRAELETERAQLMPNPATGQFRLVLPADHAEVIVTDVLGRRMLTLTDAGRDNTINAKDWNPGLYFVQVTTSGRDRQVLRVVIK